MTNPIIEIPIESYFLTESQSKDRGYILEIGEKLYIEYKPLINKKAPEGYICAILPIDGIIVLGPKVQLVYSHLEEKHKGKIFYVAGYVSGLKN